MILFILVVMGIFIYFYIDKSNFENSSYKNESGNDYFSTKFNAGNYGEYLTFSKLETIKGKLAVNVYVPKENGETTELDLIFIHETGIYVL